MKKSELKQVIKEEIQKVLSEVGEGTGKIYNWRSLKNSKEGSEYAFDSENTDYIVEIYPREIWAPGTVIVSFSANSSDESDNRYEKITNFNEVYSVMATIMDIIVEHIKANKHVYSIVIAPSKSFETDERREKLYRAYVRKNIGKLPGRWDSTSTPDDEIILFKHS
jgi:hypothetical protein